MTPEQIKILAYSAFINTQNHDQANDSIKTFATASLRLGTIGKRQYYFACMLANTVQHFEDITYLFKLATDEATLDEFMLETEQQWRTSEPLNRPMLKDLLNGQQVLNLGP
jgi:hypothetical protein